MSGTIAGMETRERLSLWKRAGAKARPTFSLTFDDIDLLILIGRNGVVDAGQLSQATGRNIISVRRRLKYLFQHCYVGRPVSQKQTPAFMEEGDGRATMYVLKPRGVKAVAEGRGLMLRGYANDAGLSALLHERACSEFMLRLSGSGDGRPRLIWRDELAPLLREHEDRDGDRWKVNVLYKGKNYAIWVRPDQVFSLVDLSKIEESGEDAAKFYILERDRGTMPLKRKYLSQSSIFRKFLAYSETYKTKKHTACLGFPNVRFLFLANSAQRAEGMRKLFRDHEKMLCSQNLFLFNDWSTLVKADSLYDVLWQRADGSERPLYL